MNYTIKIKIKYNKNIRYKVMDEKFDCIVDNGNVIDTAGNTGWVCPKCGAVVAPSVLVCPVCGGKRTNESIVPGESMICG